MYATIQGRPISIGIVGCGRIAAKHVEAIQQLPNDLTLVAVCDERAEVVQAAAAHHGIAGYQQLEDMLQQETLDLVALCTPSGLHAPQALSVAQHGVHVISEKPMATRWADGLAMVQACDQAGVRLFVVKQNRQNATLQLLKKALVEQRFGRIHLVHINVFWSRPQAYYDQSDWRGTWALDGGAFMNQASHYVDLLSWLIGPVAEVHAMTSKWRNIEAEDTGVLNIRWRDGTLGSMAVTMCTYPKNLEGSITILGETGTVKIGGVAVNNYQHWQFQDQRDYDTDVHTTSYDTASVYGFGHGRYYKNVVAVLRGQAEPETDGREGLKSLEILIAAYQSAKERKTVSLPLAPL